MARKGAATPSGLVLFDKPAGPSSFAIVRDLREKTGARAGHAGTLDPFATGLLLVLLGSFTKQAQRFVGLSKRYETAVDLSKVTSTGDPEGEIVEEHDPPSEVELETGSKGLRGEVDLKIPAASAVKIGGERAYKLHRRGVAVEMPMRRTTVHELELVDYEEPVARLAMRLSSGGYVRAVAEALGGHCVSLRRTHVGPFASMMPTPTGSSPPTKRSPRSNMKVTRATDRLATSRASPHSARSTESTSASTRDRGRPRRRPGADGRHLRSHPRTALGHRVELLSSLERRLELLRELGVEATVLVEFTLDLARLEPEEFANRSSARSAREIVIAGEDFRFGRGRPGDPRSRPARLRDGPVPLLEGVSSTGSVSSSRRATSKALRGSSGGRLRSRAIVAAGDARGGDARLPDGEPRGARRSSSSPPRDLRGLGPRATGCGPDRDDPHYGGCRAAHRGAPPRLRRRPLRAAARRPALGAATDEAAFDTEDGLDRSDRQGRRGHCRAEPPA